MHLKLRRRVEPALVLTAAIAIGALSGCTKSPSTPQAPRTEGSAALDQPLTLHVGETAALAGTTLSLTFERVPEDSRCPINVNCVWAGNAVVRLAVRVAGATRDPIELHTTTIDKREATIDGFRVRLVQLAPARTEGTALTQDQYAATLTVVRSS